MPGVDVDGGAGGNEDFLECERTKVAQYGSFGAQRRRCAMMLAKRRVAQQGSFGALRWGGKLNH